MKSWQELFRPSNDSVLGVRRREDDYRWKPVPNLEGMGGAGATCAPPGALSWSAAGSERGYPIPRESRFASSHVRTASAVEGNTWNRAEEVLLLRRLRVGLWAAVRGGGMLLA
eukprot:GHVU01062019.1.p1 GENE.GHVU01062019.1~~GHVU01062019.1.p1  ORF type:complete len:113 (-),score=3.66 GHVU01062019.1:125-463(-)